MLISKHYKSAMGETKHIQKSLEVMSIGEESEGISVQSTEEENRYKLFKEIRMLDHFNRKKRQWICQEFSDRLFKLFEEFPNDHAVIKKALKISNSTYHRLMKEGTRKGSDQRSIKRAERSPKKLNQIEKSLVELMIKPPTTPLTLNEI